MIVLDTHVWVWWTAQPPKLSARARSSIEASGVIGVSAITCWEVAMLVARGRLEFDREVLLWIRQALDLPRVVLLHLTPEIAVRAAHLDRDAPGDPADRMIAATALEARAPLVTRDKQLRAIEDLRCIW